MVQKTKRADRLSGYVKDIMLVVLSVVVLAFAAYPAKASSSGESGTVTEQPGTENTGSDITSEEQTGEDLSTEDASMGETTEEPVTEEPTTEAIQEGRPYYIVPAGQKLKVGVSCKKTSDIKNRLRIVLGKPTTKDVQKFVFTKKDEQYLIKPYKCSRYTMNVTSLERKAKLETRRSGKERNNYWLVDEVEGGFTFRLAANPKLYLTVVKGNLMMRGKSRTYCQVFELQDAMTVMLDVPTISQKDKRWVDFEFVKKAKPKCTIGRYGCLLTSVTAVMSYKKGKLYRPDKYYKKLKFIQADEGNPGAAGGMYIIDGWEWHGRFKLATIKKQLDKGNPVIVGGGGKHGFHYAVVYGYKDGGTKAADYYVMDPSDLSTTLREHINKYGKGLYYEK